jgi:hypothetical protein
MRQGIEALRWREFNRESATVSTTVYNRYQGQRGLFEALSKSNNPVFYGVFYYRDALEIRCSIH